MILHLYDWAVDGTIVFFVSCILGLFFISNRLLLTGYLDSAQLSVEKERLSTQFRRRHAFHPMPAI